MKDQIQLIARLVKLHTMITSARNHLDSATAEVELAEPNEIVNKAVDRRNYWNRQLEIRERALEDVLIEIEKG